MKINKINRTFIAVFGLALLLIAIGSKYEVFNAIGIGIALTVVGSSIAYWGDIIGHTIGKKRHSTFNLRPRETAVLWTIAGGGATALLTFIILLMVSAGFRDAVFNGAKLVRQNRMLSVKIADAETLAAKAQQSAQSADGARDAAQQRAQDARAQEQKSVDELGKTRTALDTAANTLLSAQQNLQRRQADLDRTESQLTGEQASLKLTRAERDRLQKQGQIARAQLADARIELTAATKSISYLYNIVKPQLIRQLANRLIYDNEQEVGRVVIPNEPTDTIIADLNKFLAHLGDDAKAEGAVDDPVTGQAVKVATVQILSTDPSVGASSHNAPEYADQQENLAALADQIRSGKEPAVVVIAYSVGNSFEKAPVVVQLRPYLNKLTIPKGTVVATTLTTPSENSAEAVMAKIQTMLQKQVRPHGIHHGIIPVKENARDQAQVGDVPLAEIIKAIEDVQAMKGAAVIDAYVPDDVYSADQLHLHLSVKPAETDSSAGGPAL